MVATALASLSTGIGEARLCVARDMIVCTTDPACDSHHDAFEPAVLGGGGDGRTSNVREDDNRE